MGPSRCSGRRTLVTVVALATSLTAGFAATASTAAASAHYPVVYSVVAALGGAFAPDSPPPGANNWACHPTTAHPDPVVLVNGTFANEDNNWQTLSPLLANNGYCVFTFNYGGPPALGSIYGIHEIGASAGQLSTFVNRVTAATGAAKVDLVGHSQGGMMPHYYLRFLGGAAHVKRLVALAPSNRGTTLGGLTQLANYIPGVSTLVNAGLANTCEACVEQEAGSTFITHLNAGGITVPGVTYTVISTKYDEVVTPYTSQALTGSNVTNIVIQNQCPIDFDGHAGLAFDHIALRDVLNALDPAHTSPPFCTFIPFETGG
ncbi:MAG: alpha/beta fold hydrolase [Actinomycetia bacterium]|nr:alpha/beta fold hydrolase [Actinomycetes bacterium]